MRAGELDRVAGIQEKVITQSDTGEQVIAWNTYISVPARKRFMRGDERFQSMQTVAAAELVFTVRYLENVSPQNRLICEGIEYDITAVLELGRHEGLDLYCKTRAEL